MRVRQYILSVILNSCGGLVYMLVALEVYKDSTCVHVCKLSYTVCTLSLLLYITHYAVSEYKDFIPNLLRQLVEVTWRTRGKYVCLQHVLTHTGDASRFLELSPSLPSLVLKAMEQHSVALCVSIVVCVVVMYCCCVCLCVVLLCVCCCTVCMHQDTNNFS